MEVFTARESPVIEFSLEINDVAIHHVPGVWERFANADR